jgi:signal transduction histidine kinase
MRLLRKLAVVWIAALIVVVGVAELFRERRQRAIVEARDLAELEAAARAVVAALDAPRAPSSSAPELSAPALLATASGVEIRRAPIADVPPEVRAVLELGRLVPRALEGRREVWVPIEQQGQLAGAVVASGSLEPDHDLARASALEAVVTVLCLAAIAGALAWLLGTVLVGRPIDRLVAKARRVGAGDFEGPLALDRADEIGILAHEIDQMCEQLARARERLLEETQARVAAIDQLRHADRLTTVGKLASGLAHEFGTPLNVISARAKMIHRGEIPPEEAPRAAQPIIDAADRLTRLVRQLLDFARRRPGDRRPEDLRAAARQTASLLGDLARGKEIEIVVEAGERAIEAVVDRGRIEQVLTNLVVNAIHASPNGAKVTVSLGTELHAPHPAATPSRWAFLRVHDHGPGIPKEHRERIFEPFFTTKPVGQGTGLGLAVAYGIVEEHGGSLEVDCEGGAGTTFTIWLPLAGLGRERGAIQATA